MKVASKIHRMITSTIIGFGGGWGASLSLPLRAGLGVR